MPSRLLLWPSVFLLPISKYYISWCEAKKYFNLLSRCVLSRAREIDRRSVLSLSSGLCMAECGPTLGFSTVGSELLKSLYHKSLDEQLGFIHSYIYIYMTCTTCVERNRSLFLCLLPCPAATFSSSTSFFVLSTLPSVLLCNSMLRFWMML